MDLGNIIVKFTPMVHKTVASFQRRCPKYRNVDSEDLVQEGILGIMEAFQRFDPSRGVSFSTYVFPWIHKYVRRAALEDGQFGMVVPQQIFSLRSRDRKLQETSQDSEIQKKLKVSPHMLDLIRNLPHECSESEESPMLNKLPCKNCTHEVEPNPEIFTPVECQIIKLKLDGYTDSEIRSKLNMDRDDLHNNIKSLQNKLRNSSNE
jgi:RNA polymerase sigma factor (sigma-70 family)